MSKVSFEKSKIKFLLLEEVHPVAVEQLKEAGYSNIDYRSGAIDENELKIAIRDAHFIGIRSRTQLTKEVLGEAKKLIAIGCFCIGTNQVDLETAAYRGIPVFNAPFSNTRSVAELVLGQIIFLLRKIPESNAKAHRGEWAKVADGCFEVRGKKLGIIGYGHIGIQLGILAESLGMQVYYYDIEKKLSLGNAQQVNSMQELLKMSDAVSLHVPETPQTQNMMTSAEFAMMKPGAIFINAARGTVVDIDALCERLKDKHIKGAAIDVFPVEPVNNKEPFVSPLLEFDNVILTPHIGGSTQEAQENIGIEVSSKLIKYSDNGSTLFSVNFPEVSLPVLGREVSRLLHIHENRPGIMNSINQIFAQEKINIVAQYLQTSLHIGYVVIDVESDRVDQALELIEKIEGTIKTRMLY